MDWDWYIQATGVGRCKLLHLKWINKVLIYRMGNCIQYPVKNHNQKEYFKIMYICTQLSHFVVKQRLAQHCK